MTPASPKPLFSIPLSTPFNLRLMLLSHGWYELEPFRWDDNARTLLAVLETHPGRVYAVTIAGAARDPAQPGLCRELAVFKAAGDRVTARDTAALERRVRWIFRLEEDLTGFQSLCAADPSLEWVQGHGLGAFLRNGTLFEEFVKVLLTTNVNWAGTRSMNGKLIEHLGRPVTGGSGFDPPLRAFPDPQAIAAVSEEFLREKVRVGYRAPFLLELAKSVASGSLSLDEFLDPTRRTEDLAKSIGRLKGFGPYAVSALLQTAGRYDRLILDSWIRKKAAQRYFDADRVPDSSIEAAYRKWGRWKALACWFECAYDTWLKEQLMPGDK